MMWRSEMEGEVRGIRDAEGSGGVPWRKEENVKEK
jgi:hypothetical protein